MQENRDPVDAVALKPEAKYPKRNRLQRAVLVVLVGATLTVLSLRSADETRAEESTRQQEVPEVVVPTHDPDRNNPETMAARYPGLYGTPSPVSDVTRSQPTETVTLSPPSVATNERPTSTLTPTPTDSDSTDQPRTPTQTPTSTETSTPEPTRTPEPTATNQPTETEAEDDPNPTATSTRTLPPDQTQTPPPTPTSERNNPETMAARYNWTLTTPTATQSATPTPMSDEMRPTSTQTPDMPPPLIATYDPPEPTDIPPNDAEELLATIGVESESGQGLPVEHPLGILPADLLFPDGTTPVVGGHIHRGQHTTHHGIDIVIPPEAAELNPARLITNMVPGSRIVYDGWDRTNDHDFGLGRTRVTMHLVADPASGLRYPVFILYGHLRDTAETAPPSGEAIGIMGNTGESSGPHLHLEMFIGTEPYDPATQYLDQDVQGGGFNMNTQRVVRLRINDVMEAMIQDHPELFSPPPRMG